MVKRVTAIPDGRDRYRFVVDGQRVGIFLRKGGGYRWTAYADLAGQNPAPLFAGASRIKMVASVSILINAGIDAQFRK